MTNKTKDTICTECGKRDIQKNELAACKKILGRQVQKVFCLQCLAQYLDTTQELLLEKIEEFKSGGCTMFE